MREGKGGESEREGEKVGGVSVREVGLERERKRERERDGGREETLKGERDGGRGEKQNKYEYIDIKNWTNKLFNKTLEDFISFFNLILFNFFT